MTEFSLISALILGVVEGLTEFLPISSTAHMLAVTSWLELAPPEGKHIEMSLQLGSIFAVCLLYIKKLCHVLTHLHKERDSQMFVRNLLCAFIPTALAGLFFHSAVREALGGVDVMAMSLIIGGFVIFMVEFLKPAPSVTSIESMAWRVALMVGCCQALAMVPGVSRSGATIMAALALGVDRKVAVEFSFLLAIPTMLAATLYSMMKLDAPISPAEWEWMGVGFLVSLVTALVVVKGFLKFISAHSFSIFGWYRILFGLALWAPFAL